MDDLSASARVGGLFMLVVIVGSILTFTGSKLFPETARIAAPVICPHRYVRSTVRSWATRNESGKGSSQHIEMSCIRADGTAEKVGSVPVWLGLFVTYAVPLLLAGLIFLLVHGLVRRRARGANPF